jgi:hypothetical protein
MKPAWMSIFLMGVPISDTIGITFIKVFISKKRPVYGMYPIASSNKLTTPAATRNGNGLYGTSRKMYDRYHTNNQYENTSLH